MDRRPGYTILVVEDEQFLQLTLKAILSNAGYQVDCLGLGREIAPLLERRSYDLLFLDLNLSDINSLELLPDLHAQDPEMKVVIFSADGTPNSMQASYAHGASDYILKPADPDVILERVRRVLESHS